MSENQNLENDTHIKYVSFDLSTEELKKHFPRGTAKAYEQIAKFFFSKGFDKQQYSGYISKQPLNDIAIALIMKELSSKFTWLKDCIQKFDVSNVPNNFSYAEFICNNAEKAERKRATKIQMLTERLDREVAYYEKSKNSFYTEAKIRIENTIIGLCNELMQNGETIKDKNLKTFQTIIKERNSGKGHFK